MGRCLSIGLKPSEVSINIPGGVKIASMANFPQMVPNAMDPFQTLLQGAQPALGAIQPAFDIIGFAMKLMNCQMLIAKVLGSVMNMFSPGNPFSLMFSVDPMRDENGDKIKLVPEIEVAGQIVFEGGPDIPDYPGIAPAMLDCLAGLLGSSLKLAGLVPQLSMAVTIKDSVLTAMGFANAAMAQVNSLTDLFTSIPAANTGFPEIDAILQCTADNAGKQLEHKLGPVGNLVPLMSVISTLATVASQPLPSVIFDIAKFLANPAPEGFGLLPFPEFPGGPTSDEQREQFLGVIEEMTVSGLPIEIPDFSDMSSIGDTLNELQGALEPVLPVIEMIQSVFNKLTEA